MHHIAIPDPLYVEVQRAAEASGVSVDRFVREAVQLYLHDGPEAGHVQLSPEQVALIRESQAEIKAGNGVPFDVVKAELIADRAAWPQANQN